MEKWLGWLSSRVGVGAAASILMMVLLILTEVILRTMFNRSTLLAHEYSGYLMIFFAFASLAEVLRKDRHIKIRLVISRLPHKVQKVLDVFTSLLALSLAVYMIFWSFDMALFSFQRMETAQTVMEMPLFIPMFFIPFGLAFFALQCVARIAEVIKKG